MYYVEGTQFVLTHPLGRRIRWQDCLHSGILSYHRLRRNFIKPHFKHQRTQVKTHASSIAVGPTKETRRFSLLRHQRSGPVLRCHSTVLWAAVSHEKLILGAPLLAGELLVLEAIGRVELLGSKYKLHSTVHIRTGCFSESLRPADLLNCLATVSRDCYMT